MLDVATLDIVQDYSRVLTRHFHANLVFNGFSNK